MDRQKIKHWARLVGIAVAIGTSPIWIIILVATIGLIGSIIIAVGTILYILVYYIRLYNKDSFIFKNIRINPGSHADYTFRIIGKFLRRAKKTILVLHTLIVILLYIGGGIFVYKYFHNQNIQDPIACSTQDVEASSRGVSIITGDSGDGTAFWINETTVVTNNHVVDHNKNLKIDHVYFSQVIATDSLRDIAIVKVIKTPDSSTKILDGYKGDLTLAADVYAIGYPMGRNLSVTKGVVSAFTKDDYDDRNFIQTDAAISPGNSGGPLVDRCGRVVGMVTQTLRGAENVGYALEYRQLKQRVDEMIASNLAATPQELELNYPSEQAEVVAKYYNTLGGGDIAGAYDFFSSVRKAKLPYAGWQVGLSRTIFIRLISVTLTDKPNTVQAHFYASEYKNDTSWESTTSEFEGTWVLVREGGLWKMNDSNIKLIKTFTDGS